MNRRGFRANAPSFVPMNGLLNHLPPVLPGNQGYSLIPLPMNGSLPPQPMNGIPLPMLTDQSPQFPLQQGSSVNSQYLVNLHHGLPPNSHITSEDAFGSDSLDVSHHHGFPPINHKPPEDCFVNDTPDYFMSSQQSPTVLAQQSVDRDKIYQWIVELSNPESRENALLELSKKREVVPDLAPMLWHSFGTISALLQEIINIYPAINPATLTAHQSNRVCNALALLQCVASHPETRSVFLQAHIPLFLYPFLHTVSKTRPFEYLRLTSLGVIGALVKTDEQEVITFLLTTEIIPLCLRIMESGSELSKTVATFILQKILLDDSGLSYICQTYDRFSHVAMILGKMVLSLAKDPSARLLKHVVRCYLRLSDNARAREALRQCLPDQLRDCTFTPCLQEDKSTKHWLAQLIKNLETAPGVVPVGMSPLVPQA